MKKTMLVLIVFCLLALVAAPAGAVSLSLNPASQAIPGGGAASVDLVVSNLGSYLLGGFDVTITFDPLILLFDSVSFGSTLGVPDSDYTTNDASPYETSIFVDTLSDSVRLFEVSWLFPLPSQPASFSLATLNFNGFNYGFSELGLGNVVLSDDYGNDLADFTNVTTTGAGISVPEPATMLLLGIGLAGLAGFGRRKSGGKAA